MPLTLEEAKQRFSVWRSQKKYVREPIPEELWDLALELSSSYGQSTVAYQLNINPRSLRHRCPSSPSQISLSSEPSPGFVELSLSSVSSISCQRIEIERNDGHRLTLSAPANTPFSIPEVIQLFLGGGNASTQCTKQNLFGS